MSTTWNSMPIDFANRWASLRSFPPFPSGSARARTRSGPIASAQSFATSAESMPPLRPRITPFRPLSRTEWTMNASMMKTCSSLYRGTRSMAGLPIGTGTGLLACLVAPFVRPQGVVAIDLADGAISVASYRAGNAGIRNIRFEMLDSRNIVYHGKLFDAAVSNLGIPVFGWDRVFQEVHRVLKPGGRFIFSEWPTDN